MQAITPPREVVRGRITVVTICRNVCEELTATVSSVLAQDDPDVEYLIIDGASTDGTLAFLAAQTDARLRYTSEPDTGISDAMNKGIEQATGEWIIHLHAADTFLPNALAAVRVAISENQTAALVCHPIVKAEDASDVICEAAPDRLPIEMSVPHPGVVAQTEILRAHGGFDKTLKNAMDYDLFLRCYLAGETFAVSNVPISRFVAGGQSERSLWATLSETHAIRRRLLSQGWQRSRLFLVALWVKGRVRMLLQQFGLHGVVASYRSRFAYPRKIPIT
jgi:glycosyltransferase involved in cell wall biosynthesis